VLLMSSLCQEPAPMPVSQGVFVRRKVRMSLDERTRDSGLSGLS
jgi:hypothetical protein